MRGGEKRRGRKKRKEGPFSVCWKAGDWGKNAHSGRGGKKAKSRVKGFGID